MACNIDRVFCLWGPTRLWGSAGRPPPKRMGRSTRARPDSPRGREDTGTANAPRRGPPTRPPTPAPPPPRRAAAVGSGTGDREGAVPRGSRQRPPRPPGGKQHEPWRVPAVARGCAVEDRVLKDAERRQPQDVLVEAAHGREVIDPQRH